jgi:nucleotide-binding universal stress UspA family protein
MMWKTLLVPHDFSPSADRALRVAADLAKLHGGSIALLHVSELPENVASDAVVEPAGVPVRVDEYAKRGGLRQLEVLAAPIRAEGVAVRVVAMTGDVFKAILEATDQVRADVIVLGTHGRTGLSHLLLGSVAETVVRHSIVPVVTVRSHASEAQRTREESTVEDELAG